MIVATARVRRWPVGPSSFGDITGKEVLRTGWTEDTEGNSVFEVQFAVNLTAAEQEAVLLRLGTADANEETTRARAWAAADGLRQIRDSTGTLTAANLSTAVRLLARVALYLLRLQLGRTDTVETEPGTTPAPVTEPTQPAPGRNR